MVHYESWGRQLKVKVGEINGQCFQYTAYVKALLVLASSSTLFAIRQLCLFHHVLTVRRVAQCLLVGSWDHSTNYQIFLRPINVGQSHSSRHTVH